MKISGRSKAMAWVAGAAGLIGIAAAAGGSGGSSHSDNGANSGDHTGPKLTIDVIDNNKINIKADEASKIEIKDANGNTIGSGQLNQAGEIDITLSRPLQQGERGCPAPTSAGLYSA